MAVIQEPAEAFREGPPIRLRLNTVRNARLSLARVTREYANGRIPAAEAKSIAYLITQLLGFFRLENETEIETRIAEIEKRLDGLGL